MIADLFLNVLTFVLSLLPTISFPLGLAAAVNWLASVVGYINIFIPLNSVAAIITGIIVIRNWNAILSVLKFVFRFIPFIDGGK